MKYIIYEKENVILFPDELEHKFVAESLRLKNLQSAGFVYFSEGLCVALGESSSLGIASRKKDGEIIQAYLQEN